MQQPHLLSQILVLAEGHLREGRLTDGIDAYQRALALRPNLPDAWYNLAYLQRHARQFSDALASYAQALKHGVDRPEDVHLNRAAIFGECLGDDTAAEAELRKALELDPRFLTAWLNLGNLYEDVGSVDKARLAYESALAIAPGNGRALARLAAIDAFAGHPGERLADLRAALNRPGLSRDEVAEVSFALGSALDGLGRFDEAFKFFSFANKTVRERLSDRARYDRGAHERLVDHLIAMEPPASTLSDGKAAGPTPIFICGLFRSGSTLCEQILGRHSRVTPAGELDIIPALVREHLQPYPKMLSDLSSTQVTDLRDSYLAQVRALHPHAEVITDKRPDNFLHIGLIKAMFPEAKIIHTIREPLDNILSIYFLYFADSVSYGFSLDDIGHWVQQYQRLMQHWKRLYRRDIHDFYYDELVVEAEPLVAKMQEFCGLEPEPLLRDATNSGSVRTPSAWQVRKPLHRRSSGRWHNYAAHLADVRSMLNTH